MRHRREISPLISLSCRSCTIWASIIFGGSSPVSGGGPIMSAPVTAIGPVDDENH
jgi:hypothetical protein